MARLLTAAIVAGLLVGCSLDWEALDPRAAGDATTTSGVGGAGTGGTDAPTGGIGGVGGDSSSGGGSSTGGGAIGGGGAGGGGPVGFLDAFDRPDGPLGNGWLEKTSDVYAIENERVVKVATPTASYRDVLAYRPASEDRLDAEIRLAFETLSASVAFPQIFVRGQSATIGTVNAYDGYLFYVAGSATEAVLGRQLGTPFVSTLATVAIAPPLAVGETYRLRLSARGTDPVQLEAYVEQLVSGSWTVVGMATHDDAAPERIGTAGTVGFSGNESDTFVYDDFERIDL